MRTDVDNSQEAQQKELEEWKKAFCEYYLQCFNATQAYKRARPGVKDSTANTNAPRILADARVQAYLKKLRAELRATRLVTAQRVLDELASLAFVNITDIVGVSADGQTLYLRDLNTLTDVQTRAIQHLDIKEVTNKRGEAERLYRVRLYDKVKALELCARHLGLFTDKTEQLNRVSYSYETIAPDGSHYAVSKPANAGMGNSASQPSSAAADKTGRPGDRPN